MPPPISEHVQYREPVKRITRTGGSRDTHDTHGTAHAGKRITRSNLTTIHPNPKSQTRTKTATDSTAARTAASPESTAPLPVKRHRGAAACVREPEHKRETKRDTRAHTGTRITQTNLTTIQT